MFNPYVSPLSEALHPVSEAPGPLSGLQARLQGLDRDDLLILLLLYLLLKEGPEDRLWPLLGALLYLLL
jgi:hypothetical protein